jgi:hypothetical protein
MFSIKYITTKSSARDQPFLYLFISYLTNLILLFQRSSKILTTLLSIFVFLYFYYFMIYFFLL